MATAPSVTKNRIPGGSFLISEQKLDELFTPEDFTEQHQMVAQTAEEFATKEVVPNIEKLEKKDWPLTRELIRKASELGLGSVDIPEQYGGMEMDKISSAIITDKMAKSGSFMVSFTGHNGIGTLPVVFFGTEEQKQKYLPRMASGEMVGAYALSESSSGSDALSIRTRAELSPDGKHYILNGEKMWITNASFADVFTVAAKVDGDKFTAFLVERGTPGLAIGAEEHKMGIRGSSTCPLILNDCKVPVANVLGEIGKGHHVFFNILNVGRFKLGAGCVGGARLSLQQAIQYAKQRKAFGKTIADFGLIKEKLANIAVGIYAGESMVYRTVGMMDVALGELDKSAADITQQIRRAIEDYAVECSIAKVWCSEMLDRTVDDVVQIYGGYGFVEEYPAERAYRDSRVNRIFEGTNEINRMIITGWLLKQAMSGKLPLLPAIKKLMDEVLAGPTFGDGLEGALAAERTIVANGRQNALFTAGAASQKYLQAIADQQEIMAALADIISETYVMESALLRAQKLVANQGEALSALVIAMTQVYLQGGMEKIDAAAKKITAAIAEGDMLRTQLAILKRLSKYEPFNTIALRQQIADRVLDAGKYVIA